MLANIILVATALSISVLAFFLYQAFGFAAIQATLPFVAALAFAFAVAHYLDTKDAKEGIASDSAAPKSAPSNPSGRDEGLQRKADATAAVPRRRRVAD